MRLWRRDLVALANVPEFENPEHNKAAHQLIRRVGGKNEIEA